MKHETNSSTNDKSTEYFSGRRHLQKIGISCLSIISLASFILFFSLYSFNIFFGRMGLFQLFDDTIPSIFIKVPAFVSLLLSLVSLALIVIRKSFRGLVCSVIPIIFWCFYVCIVIGVILRAQIREFTGGNIKYHLHLVGKTMINFSEKNNGYLPRADNWCDSLMEFSKDITKGTFKSFFENKQACNYAFNKNLSGLRLSEIPKDTVLLFEADGGWNLSGDKELFEKRYKEQKDYHFSYVLLADGSIKTYRFLEGGYRYFDSNSVESFEPLRWKP